MGEVLIASGIFGLLYTYYFTERWAIKKLAKYGKDKTLSQINTTISNKVFEDDTN